MPDLKKFSELSINIKYEQPKKSKFEKLFKINTKVIDLDTNILVYDEFKHKQDIVNYSQRCSYDCAIMHKDKDINNETISINLPNVNKDAKYIAIVINSYNNYKFDKIPYIKLCITADNSEEIINTTFLNDITFKDKEAMVLGYFYYYDDSWKFFVDGTTFSNGDINKVSYKVKDRL